jgi:hypothetical protein
MPWSRFQIRRSHPEYFKDGDITLVCMASTDGMCPFKDKKAISLWPFVLTVLNLPLSMRYHCKNAIFLSVGTGPDNRQPTNFATHHSLVVDDLIEAAQGWDIEVDGVTRRVRVIVPVFSCDGRGQTALSHTRGNSPANDLKSEIGTRRGTPGERDRAMHVLSFPGVHGYN